MLTRLLTPADEAAIFDLLSSTTISGDASHFHCLVSPTGFGETTKQHIRNMRYAHFRYFGAFDNADTLLHLVVMHQWCNIENNAYVPAPPNYSYHMEWATNKIPLERTMDPGGSSDASIEVHNAAHRHFRDAGYTSYWICRPTAITRPLVNLPTSELYNYKRTLVYTIRAGQMFPDGFDAYPPKYRWVSLGGVADYDRIVMRYDK